jgi:hypothetical protein
MPLRCAAFAEKRGLRYKVNVNGGAEMTEYTLVRVRGGHCRRGASLSKSMVGENRRRQW